MERSRNVQYIVPASQYPITGVAKEYWGEGNFVPYRAYWLLNCSRRRSNLGLLEAILAEGQYRLMSRRGEPVKHTCPDIDRLIKTVTEIVAGMNFCKEEDTMEDTLSLMSDWKN
jgi:hypothetical protein